jgi:DNA-directed RNA polymerase subunit N (RpoN/RPB10)
MIRVTVAELKESLFHTMSGCGNLKANHKIKTINTILLDRHNIPRTQSMRNFMGYFYENELDQRFDRSKCSLKTYLNSCVHKFLLKDLNRRDTIKRREDSVEEFINQDTMESDFMAKGFDGVWRVSNDVFYADWVQTNTRNIEDEYIYYELMISCASFISQEFGNTYTEIFQGRMTQQKASKELGVDNRTVRRKMVEIKIQLKQYLFDLGYTEDDIHEILNKKL